MLITRRLRHGTFLYDPDDMIGRLLDRYGEWSENELAFLLRIIGEGDTVADVGAHIGCFTVPFARRVGPSGTVVAFEAQRLIFHNLVANLVANDLTNVWAHNLICSRERYFLKLRQQTTADTTNTGSYRIETWPRHPQRWNHTRAEPLDATLAGIRQLRLLKVDVEGFEREVLAGAAETLRRLRPIVHCECLNSESMAFLRDLAAEHGYRTFGACFDHFNPGNFLGDTEPLPVNGLRDTNLMMWPDGLAMPDGLRLSAVANFEELVAAPSPRWETSAAAPGTAG